MAVINPFDLSIPDIETHSRLFLRDSELDFGIATIFEVTAKLKSVCEADPANAKYSWAEIRALLAIHAKSDTVLNLASRMAITKQALTKILRNLEEMELIIRTHDRRDKRRNLLTLSEKGQAEVLRISVPMREIIARAYRKAGAEAVYGSDQVMWSVLGAHKQAR